MAFMKYHAICDDGRRCQSCCNRCQIFGSRDVVSGWCGDCSECNVRWYRADFNKQLRCASHQTRRTVSQENLFSVGAEGTSLIYRYLGLCPVFERMGRISYHRLRLLESTLTSTVDSDDDSFAQDQPLTRLSVVRLSSGLERHLLRGLPRRHLTVLDAISINLAQRPSGSECLTFQSQDYALETCWSMHQSQERYWMYNSITGEWFYTDAAAPWIAYRYQHAIWWLNGRRWFWGWSQDYASVAGAILDVQLHNGRMVLY